MTPEERLLRLIRRHPHQRVSSASAESESSREASLKGVEATTPPVQTVPKAFVWPPAGFNMRFVQKSLGGILLFNLLILGGGVVFHQNQLAQLDRFLSEASAESTNLQDRELLQLTKDLTIPLDAAATLSELNRAVQEKELFRHLAAPQEKGTADKSKGPTVSQRLKELTLMGIVASPSAQAIIDDASSKKSYFLKEGEEAADFKVIRIQPGKVVLEIFGESAELTL